MQADIRKLEGQLTAIARRFVSPEEADYFADLYVQTHLKKTPRMNPLAEAVADLAAWNELTGNEVANLLPIGGGFKGFGIALLIEVLTGALVQSLLSTDQTPGWHPHEYGCLVLALDIAGFTDSDAFKHAVSDMCRNLRNETPADGAGRVAVPGDRGHEKLKMARKVGRIEMDNTLVDALDRLNA